MSTESDIKITNTVVLATVTELTRMVLSRLDGDGVDTQNPDSPVDNKVLNTLIASRIRNRLSTQKL